MRTIRFNKITIISIILIISVSFALLFLYNQNKTIIISIVLLFIPIGLYLIKQINDKIEEKNITGVKKIALYFFFIYPLLPGFAGINLGGGLPVFTSHRILIIIFCIYLLKKGLLFKYYGNFFKSSIITFPILFIFISIILTAIFSANFSGTIFRAFYFIFDTIILPVIVYNVFKDREDINLLINVLCIPAVILCILGLYEMRSGYNIYTIFGAYDSVSSALLSHSTRDGIIRIASSFGEPISFGTYLGLISSALFYKFKNRIFLLLPSLALLFFVIRGTQSRGALIGFFIMSAFYIIFYGRKYIPYFIIIMIVLIPFINIKYYINFFQQINPFTVTDEALIGSTEARFDQFDNLKDEIWGSPLVGNGLVPFVAEMRSIFTYNTTSIDSFYLAYTFNYGFFGLFSWILLMLFAFFLPIKYYGVEILKDDLLPFLLITIVVFCVVNFVVCLYDFHFVFWIYAGIISRLIVNKRMQVYAERHNS